MPAAPARRAPPQVHAIRWDRVGRIVLLGVLFGLVVLYVGPARSYVQALGQAKAREAEVRTLQREHDRLEARRRALSRPGVIEAEARRLGYVKPGERPYIVEDLPK
ncbi:MAG TPA: septum formation initiator family protein [Solirubrobacteraceae bacterium]|jgi:cell division protein FtsB